MARFDLSIALQQGAFLVNCAIGVDARALALVGPSGSGKTSVLESIAGLRRPRAGRIVIDGRVLFDAAAGVDVLPRHRRIGYVPQDVLLFPHLDVRANIAYGAPMGAASNPTAIVDLLELGGLLDRRVSSLSGGEKQRVALARALHSEPQLLLLDEPLAAIDVARRHRILDELRIVRDRLRIPIVYVTHVADEAIAIADHVVALSEGRVVAEGEPGEILKGNGGRGEGEREGRT